MSRRHPAIRRWLVITGLAVFLLALLITAPVVTTEMVCRPAGTVSASPVASILESPWRRPLANSYLSFPEWQIAYVYEDFAAVLANGDEHAFDYSRSIADYWRSLCAITRIAYALPGDHTDMKILLYTVGISFTAEMGIKAAYEETIGRASTWIRGETPVAEDLLAKTVAADYSTFLEQNPWYDYSFAHRVKEMWALPIRSSGLLRQVERRFALSLEWGVKALYATLIEKASDAALGESDLTLRSVISGIDADAAANIAKTTTIQKLEDGRLVIETPRYRAFTRILDHIARNGGEIVEIAGNREIFVTAIAASPVTDAPPQMREILRLPLQGRGHAQRLGLAVTMDQLATLFRTADNLGLQIEHVYDY